MSLSTRRFLGGVAALAFALAVFAVPRAFAAKSDQTPAWPGDLSPAGLRAAASQAADPTLFESFLPPEVVERTRDFVRQTRAQGLERRAGTFSVTSLCPPNVHVNNNAGDAIGETQSEVAIAVYRDTVVIGWNDSRGFTAGNTISSFAYSTDGGLSFVDGGNMPLAAAGDQAFGDPGLDTDERGNWYYNQIYTRTSPTTQQNIGVHHGRFNGLGQLVWDLPVMASIGTSTTGNLDKCLLACDRVTGNVYDAYTRFTATPQIEIVRSTTLGATWGAPIVLDNTTTPTSSKQAARPFCGPGGEVYVVWEKGANLINCPDGLGDVTNTTGQIAFTRSLNFGASYDPFTVIGTVDHSWTWSGPGDLRERGNDFPDIAVDRSGGPFNGNIYVTWHESAPWTSNLSAGAVRAEVNDAGNNNPGGAEVFNVGEDVTGSISSTGDFDYWQFAATQGQTYLLNLDPQGFVCGVSGTAKGMRLRLFATQSPYPNPTGFPDSLLAASALGTFAQRIVWTAPKSGNYLTRLQRSSGTTPFTYTLRVRPLTFGPPSPARDARDVVIVRSGNQGLTWSPEWRINDDPAGLENRRPFDSVDGLGHVSVFWHDSRDPGLGSNAALTAVYGTTSRDGGVTWTPNYCVTDELSFFSFNTLAVPNLGDYNQSAANAAGLAHPAWSDQRLSTGDVRAPGTNTYTAGLGPEVYTTGIAFSHAVSCAADTFGGAGQVVSRKFRVTNTGTVPDRYDWTATSTNYPAAPGAGTTPVLPAGSFFDVFVDVTVPGNCTPVSTQLTFAATPAGDPDGRVSCTSTLYCDISTPTLVARFDVEPAAGGVDLSWSSEAVGQVRGWNVYRGTSTAGAYARLNSGEIPMGSGGSFRFHDGSAPAGAVFYRLAAVMPDGREQALQTVVYEASPAVRTLALRFAGSNPFDRATTLAYALPQGGPVRIDVYSVTGRRVATLLNRVEEAGVHTLPFELRDSAGRSLGAGVYLVRLTANGGSRTLRAVALE